MNPPDKSGNITVTVKEYLGSLTGKGDHVEIQHELFKFSRFFPSSQSISDLKPSDIETYANQMAGLVSTAMSTERVHEIKKFLSYIFKNEMNTQDLSQHIRVRKSRKLSGSKKGKAPEAIELTPEGHASLLVEIEDLRSQRGPIAIEIQHAAADKDVRENAPLEAAREQLGHVEARIRQIENTLQSVVIVDPSKRPGKSVSIGSKVALQNVDSGKKTKYTVVSATEANPLEGKISDASPVGNSLLGHKANQQIKVSTPRGTLRFLILKVT